MQAIASFLSEFGPVTAALIATVFTWLLTALGASLIFFFKEFKKGWQSVALGFTGGVMLAASFWSLLSPSIEMAAEQYPDMPWMPAAVGFTVGALFVFGLDKAAPHLHIDFDISEAEGPKSKLHSTSLLLIAIVIHNVPEGLAVGVLFGATANGAEGVTLASAVALAFGIGMQNFPEGFAVAMPLRGMGASRWKSFWYGQLSAIVEPIAGVIGAAAVYYMRPTLPYALAFAAGAMVYVVVEEVIPETQRQKHNDYAVLGLILGFVVMMVLDVALG